MKKNTYYIAIILISVFLFQNCGSAQSVSEKEQKATEIRNAIERAEYTFKATYAYPTGFRSQYLSPYYNVVVSPDTVKAYLPYYGRAYKAPVDPRDGGYRFTSTDFSYTIEQGNRSGNWLMIIKFNDLNRSVVFNFDLWENGTGRLSVIDVDKQGISYQGDIVLTKEPEE